MGTITNAHANILTYAYWHEISIETTWESASLVHWIISIQMWLMLIETWFTLLHS